MSDTRELAHRQTTDAMSDKLAVHDATPMDLMRTAIERSPDGKLDVEALRALMEMENDWQRRKDERAFAEAMAQFQANAPRIKKRRPVSFDGGRAVAYKYAAFEDIMAAIQESLEKAGLTVHFSTRCLDSGMLETVCKVKRGVYEQETAVTLPIPAGVKVNDTQKMGMALAYGKRYALMAALNIVVEDEDTDATGLGETITDKQAASITDAIEDCGMSPAKFCQAFRIERVEDLPVKRYGEAVARIEQYQKAKRERQE